MTIFKKSLLALALAPSLAAFSSLAASLAITNAKVYSATEQGVLEGTTVIVDNGVISAINPASVEADQVVDAKGKVLTPGFIGSMNQLGLVEVGAVANSRDARDKKADITFDASLAFNPKTSVIPYTRKGGITTNVSVPQGGDSIFKGQAFVAELTGDFDSVIATDKALIVSLGAKSKGSRAMDLQNLIDELESAEKAHSKMAKSQSSKKADKKKSSDSDKEPSKKEQLMAKVITGQLPVIVYADRAIDLVQLIKLKDKFGINLVIAGAEDGAVVADKLAKAEIPVIINPISNLPGGFDSLHNSLKNAELLTSAGVKIALTVGGDTHNLYQLRYNAGNAVANGLTKEQAIAAISANVADIFGLDTGRVAVGQKADLVLWSADPLDLNSHVEQMWISGQEYGTESRQDALRKRYTADTDMPRAYTK